jgi:hypothetical protein
MENSQIMSRVSLQGSLFWRFIVMPHVSELRTFVFSLLFKKLWWTSLNINFTILTILSVKLILFSISKMLYNSCHYLVIEHLHCWRRKLFKQSLAISPFPQALAFSNLAFSFYGFACCGCSKEMESHSTMVLCAWILSLFIPLFLERTPRISYSELLRKQIWLPFSYQIHYQELFVKIKWNREKNRCDKNNSMCWYLIFIKWYLFGKNLELQKWSS